MPYRYNPLTSKLDYYENIIRHDETSLLTEGRHFIAFNKAFPSEKYTLKIQVFDNIGNENDFLSISKEKNGFSIELYFPSIVRYIAVYKFI